MTFFFIRDHLFWDQKSLSIFLEQEKVALLFFLPRAPSFVRPFLIRALCLLCVCVCVCVCYRHIISAYVYLYFLTFKNCKNNNMSLPSHFAASCHTKDNKYKTISNILSTFLCVKCFVFSFTARCISVFALVILVLLLFSCYEINLPVCLIHVKNKKGHQFDFCADYGPG